jgi:hypothetical protein
LNHKEFLIALETLFEYINISGRGILLTWGIKLLAAGYK